MTEEKLPVWTFLTEYFLDAFEEVVRVAVSGNKQHNQNAPMHWAREKSTDHMNKALRHMLLHARGQHFDEDGCRHLGKAIWRLSAQLQLDIEAAQSKAPKPGTVTVICGNVHGDCICAGEPNHAGYHGDGTVMWGRPVPMHTPAGADWRPHREWHMRDGEIYDESGTIMGRTGP